MRKLQYAVSELKYTLFETGAGWVGLLVSPRGCLKATFPRQSRETAGIELGRDAGRAVYSPDEFAGWQTVIESYFRGDRVDFQGALDLSQATPFETAVWETTRSIPYGETRSYSWVARQIGKPQAPRAVGQALGRNPLPVIIPCHRVVANDGSPGGFGGGLDMKKFLLSLESAG